MSGHMQGWIGPLAIEEVSDPWATETNSTLSNESIIEFLCRPEFPIDNKTILERYQEISKVSGQIDIAPAEPRILDKLIWPLKNAKASYILGNYLGTIALAGLVAEMVAILYWELEQPKINNRPQTEDDEKCLYGNCFENLGQNRRIQILSAYKIISDQEKYDLTIVKTYRNRYLHLWSQDMEQLPKTALICYKSAFSLIAGILGQSYHQGTILHNPKLIKYLNRKGFYTPIDETASD
jgi:hypothetical protein